METLIIVLAIVAGLVAGVVISSTMLRKAIEKKSQHILKDAEEKAEMILKDKNLQAKEKFFQLKSDYENTYQEKNKEILKNENRLANERSSA
jgi:ribonuclease Y